MPSLIEKIFAVDPFTSYQVASYFQARTMGRRGRVAPFEHHPRMGPPPNTMHDDGYSADVSGSGPATREVSVTYFQHPSAFAGMCPCFGLAEDGDLLTISFAKGSATALRLDKETLHAKAARALPPRKVRPRDMLFNIDKIFTSTEGGTYFFVDELHRMVIPTLDRRITILGQTGPTEFDLRIRLDTDANKNDKVIATQPVWSDRPPRRLTEAAPDGYWFATEKGHVGVARPRHEWQVRKVRLRSFADDEKIQNSFSTNRHGVFVVTTHGLYRLQLEDDRIGIVWCAKYNRGTKKYGGITSGSGTTPSLMSDEYVLIGDGSKPMKVLLFDQKDGRLLDSQEVFGDQPGSECENSMIVAGNRVIVGNTYGYINPFRMYKFKRAPGLACFKVRSGKLFWDWYRDDIDIMSALPKASPRNDVLYLYTMVWVRPPKYSPRPNRREKGRWRWWVLGLDLRTGRTVYAIPLFESEQERDHDNGWGTICLANDAMYMGMWGGALRIGERR